MGDSYIPHPKQLESVQRAEQEASLRAAEARHQGRADGEVPPKKLEWLRGGWRRALGRRHREPRR